MSPNPASNDARNWDIEECRQTRTMDPAQIVGGHGLALGAAHRQCPEQFGNAELRTVPLDQRGQPIPPRPVAAVAGYGQDFGSGCDGGQGEGTGWHIQRRRDLRPIVGQIVP